MLSMQLVHAGEVENCDTGQLLLPSVPELEPLLEVELPLEVDPPELELVPEDDPPAESVPLSSPEPDVPLDPLLLLLKPPPPELFEHPAVLAAPTSPTMAMLAAILAAFDIATLQPGPEYVRTASRTPPRSAFAQHGHTLGREWSARGCPLNARRRTGPARACTVRIVSSSLLSPGVGLDARGKSARVLRGDAPASP
jgi:hypothetical protein